MRVIGGSRDDRGGKGRARNVRGVEEVRRRDGGLLDRVGRPLNVGLGGSRLLLVLNLDIMVGSRGKSYISSSFVRTSGPGIDDQVVVHVDTDSIVSVGIDGVSFSSWGVDLTPPAGRNVVPSVSGDSTSPPVKINRRISALNYRSVEKPLVVIVFGRKTPRLQLKHSKGVRPNIAGLIVCGVRGQASNLLLNHNLRESVP
mmetsp:Transcript_6471/g.12950  ORF Transcript_6471/g.12950 Transcript_6471/m.12950 type:complete len:200 (+) Transcript_6471:3979-4578(+)